MEMSNVVRWEVVGCMTHHEMGGSSRELSHTGCEIVLAAGEVSPYDPSVIDSIILDGTKKARERIDELSLDGSSVYEIEFCVKPSLIAGYRPSFSLSSSAISALVDLKSSFDFDPY